MMIVEAVFIIFTRSIDPPCVYYNVYGRKAKIQHLLTLEVSRYCLLASQGSIRVIDVAYTYPRNTQRRWFMSGSTSLMLAQL